MLFQFGYGIRINPGAGIYDVALKDGVIDENTDLLEPQFYLSPDVDPVWLDKRIKRFGGRASPTGRCAMLRIGPA